MATFAITVDVSPLATALELYYTHVLPDGTISAPSQKYTGVGVGGFIALPPTPHPSGYTYTINNVSLNNNTVYNFEVKQFCVDNTIEYSPIDEDHYRTNCVDLLVRVGDFDYNAQEYPIVGTWAPGALPFDPLNYSIQDYTLNIRYTVTGLGTPGNPSGQTTVIDTINVPSVPLANPGSQYVYNITSDDLTYPLAYGEIYEVAISFNIILSDGSIVNVTCPYKSVQLPYLRTYKVYGAEGWIVDWIDENNVHQRICQGFISAPNPGGSPCEGKWFLVHHRYNPTGGTSASNPYHPICGFCVDSQSGAGISIPGPYRPMYLPNPTVYNSSKVNCFPVNATIGPFVQTGVPCNCGDNGDNNTLPAWGATFQLIANGYATIPGALTIPSANVNTVCIGAPNW